MQLNTERLAGSAPTMHEHAALNEDGAVVKAEVLVVILLGPAAGAHQVDGRQEAAEYLHPTHSRQDTRGWQVAHIVCEQHRLSADMSWCCG